MSGAAIVGYERALQALLSPLMGTPGTGSLTATATASTTSIPCGAVAIPVEDGDFAEHAAVFAARNPDTEDGSWPVGTGGTAIAVESVQGGPIGNHSGGDAFRWFPVIDGIEEIATASGDITGGVEDETIGAIKAFRMVKQMAPEDWRSFLRAQLGVFPGAALVWESLVPVDGPNFSDGPRTGRMGAKGIKYHHQWALYLVSSRADSAAHRRAESQVMVQRVVEEVQGRTAGRGLRFSTNPGIQVTFAGTKGATETSFIDVVRFQTTVVTSNKSNAVANPWRKTRLVAQTDVAGDPRPPLENPDIAIDMTKSEEPEEESGPTFDDTFSGEFG